MQKKIVLLFIAGCVITGLTACSAPTVSGSTPEVEQNNKITADELEDGCLYVLNSNGKADIKEALTKNKTLDFKKCPQGDVNFDLKDTNNSDSSVDDSNAVWFTDDTDKAIPTLYEGDYLLYVSSTETPDPIHFVRYADYGYTIGISNLETQNNNGHYFLMIDDEDYTTYIAKNSDAAAITAFEDIDNLYLDKVGDMDINDDTVSAGGTITGLKKGKSYKCEFYTGSYYQDFKLTANVRAFGYLEDFTTYNYEFLHSSCIKIDLPDYFKTGYYYVNNLGMFRYVSNQDKENYNGKTYDENINWNDPIIVKKDGQVLEDPTDPDIDENAGDAGLSENDYSVENANELKQKTKSWEYINTEDKLIATIKLTNAIGNEEESILTVTKPDGEEVTVQEKEGVYVFQDFSAQVGTYKFELTNMADRQFTVKYDTN